MESILYRDGGPYKHHFQNIGRKMVLIGPLPVSILVYSLSLRSKEINLLNLVHARDICNSGHVDVKNVPLRGCAIKGKFMCMFCPIIQDHERGFDRKEDIKRHNHQHLNVSSFSVLFSR